MSLNMSIIHEIVDIFVLFVAQNRQAIEEPNKVLFFTLCQFMMFFSTECTKVHVIFVSFARKSPYLLKLGLSPVLHMFYNHIKQNYFLKKHS